MFPPPFFVKDTYNQLFMLCNEIIIPICSIINKCVRSYKQNSSISIRNQDTRCHVIQNNKMFLEKYINSCKLCFHMKNSVAGYTVARLFICHKSARMGKILNPCHNLFLEVTLLSQVINVGDSPKTLFISVDPTLGRRILGRCCPQKILLIEMRILCEQAAKLAHRLPLH